VAREKKEKEAVKAKDDEQRRKAQEYTEAAKAKAEEQRRKAAAEAHKRAEAENERAEAGKEWMRLHQETEEERTARERKEWQDMNRIMDANRYR
jgi:hypothetical protein